MHLVGLILEHRTDDLDVPRAVAEQAARRGNETASGQRTQGRSRAPEDEAWNPAPVERAATHHARLGARIDRRPGQGRGVESTAGIADERQFGVTRRVRLGEHRVARGQAHHAIDDEQRANGSSPARAASSANAMH